MSSGTARACARSTATPFPLALHCVGSVLAVKGTLRRFAPWTAPGRSEEGLFTREKGGWGFGPCPGRKEPFGHTSALTPCLCGGYPLVLNPVDLSTVVVAPTTCLNYYLFFTTCLVCSVWYKNPGGDVFGLVQIYPLGVFGLVLENSLESHKPVENQQFTSSDDPGRRGYLEPNPARKGR